MEGCHKSLKQNASTSQSLTKTLTTQASHFLTAILACSKREVLKLKCGISHFRLQAPRYAVGLKAMCHQLGQLRA